MPRNDGKEKYQVLQQNRKTSMNGVLASGEVFSVKRCITFTEQNLMEYAEWYVKGGEVLIPHN